MSFRDPFWRRTFWAFLALSLLIHIVALLFVPRRPAPPLVEERLQLRTAPRFAKPQLFSGRAPQGTPTQLERLSGPSFAPSVAAPRLPAPALIGAPQADQLNPLATEALVAQPKAAPFHIEEVVLPDLDSLAFVAMAQTAADYEGFARMHRFDADTTDAESRGRQRARQIVERAIEAMGGRPALLAIKSLQARVWIEAWEHITAAGVSTVPPYAYPVERWHFKGWHSFVRQGIPVPRNLAGVAAVEPYMLRNPRRSMTSYYDLFGPQRWSFLPAPFARLRTQGEGARWHFIDRFLGEGIVLEYIGAERFSGHRSGAEPVEVIRVNDRKYGNFFEAFFSRRSGLLYAVREGLFPAEQARHRQLYNNPAPVWTTRYQHYRPVGAVLLPHKWVRNGHLCPSCRGNRGLRLGRSTIHLKIGLNSAEPDSTAPQI